MKEEKLLVTIEQDFIEIFRKEIVFSGGPETHFISIPRGLLKEDYTLCHIRIDRKGGWKG